MSRWSLVTIAGFACAALLTASPALASNPVTYQATTTPPAGTPDITSIVVSDNTQGLVTFQINLAPGTYAQSQDSFGVYIDSDENPTTGDPTGAGTDYLVLYDGTSNTFDLYQWDGSGYHPAATTSLQASFAGDSQYFVIAASELGITDGFNFNVAAAVGSDPGQSAQGDYVPSDGTNFHYTVQSKAQISLKLSDYEDFVAKSGRIYSTAILVTRSDTAAAVTGGATIKCTISIGGHPDATVYSGFSSIKWYKGGPKKAALCQWRIPKNTGGKTLVAKESVTLGGSTVSQTFTEHIKK